VLVGTVVLAAAGFAAASIAKGPPFGASQTVTGATTATIPTGTTPARKVTICHRTGSQSNPFVKITVSQNAVPAHLAHGDHLGACTAAELKAKPKAKPKAKAKAKAKSKSTAKTKQKPKKAGSKPEDHGKPSAPGKGNGGKGKGK
jgi:hypothetical protein